MNKQESFDNSNDQNNYELEDEDNSLNHFQNNNKNKKNKYGNESEQNSGKKNAEIENLRQNQSPQTQSSITKQDINNKTGKKSEYYNNTSNDYFQSPNKHQQETCQTLETEQSPDYFKLSVANTQQKKKSNQKVYKGQKNFIKENRNIKQKNIQLQEYCSKRKSNLNQAQQTFEQINQIHQRNQKEAKSSKNVKNQRLSDWKKLQICTTVLSQQKTTYTSQKNVSRDCVVKHYYEQNSGKVNNRGGTFSSNRREKWYHQTNSSSINNLVSYKCMDIPETKEVKLFETTKGNQELKRSMNQSQVFSRNISYLKTEHVPEEFDTHRSNSKQNVIHNLNNHQVQSYRLRNISSKVF